MITPRDSSWETSVKAIKIGKRMPDAVYLHISTVSLLSKGVQKVIVGAAPSEKWNVLKLYRRRPVLSFLQYRNFDSAPYPELAYSILINLTDGNRRQMKFDASNPPILHKKELLIGPDDPRRNRWAAVTAQDVNAGRYACPSKIGFKEAWGRT